ncbi:hypothetical protein PR202_gb25225 [Eleusine coracana subsp. coracana]|uniref:F-box domain-containing protein n=1 Tax=Eleusine coracana subsp. coracana TaxID=191504 RepID=A0AAV5FKQ2_ELECO|nr:hypothetical protein PR202_gb25225 [Eleusine coracana subsp. coracana]
MSFFQECHAAFRCLTRLNLENLTFGHTDTHNLLDTCKKLQLLSLKYCDALIHPVTGEVAILTIDAPHSSLLALEITSCSYLVILAKGVDSRTLRRSAVDCHFFVASMMDESLNLMWAAKEYGTGDAFDARMERKKSVDNSLEALKCAGKTAREKLPATSSVRLAFALNASKLYCMLDSGPSAYQLVSEALADAKTELKSKIRSQQTTELMRALKGRLTLLGSVNDGAYRRAHVNQEEQSGWPEGVKLGNKPEHADAELNLSADAELNLSEDVKLAELKLSGDEELAEWDLIEDEDLSSETEEEASDGDRLSALPDDILLEILYRLGCLRWVVQASTLSRRWRRLPLLLPHIGIHISEFHNHKTKDDDYSTAMASYTEAARRLLMDRAIKVKALYLGFYLGDLQSHLLPIGQAIGNAVSKESSKHVEMSLLLLPHDPEEHDDDDEKEEELGGQQRFMAFLDASPGAFRCLTSLRLRSLRFAEPYMMPCILRNCHSLRHLRLDACGGGGVLRVDAPPTSQLVTLNIIWCKFSLVELISVPRLERMYIHIWQCECDSSNSSPPLTLAHVPKLHYVHLASALLSSQEPFPLSSCLLSSSSTMIRNNNNNNNIRLLSTVYLNFRDEMIWVRPEDPNLLRPAFLHLKNLYLHDIAVVFDLNWTLLLVEAAPSLHRLHVKLSRHTCRRDKHIQPDPDPVPGGGATAAMITNQTLIAAGHEAARRSFTHRNLMVLEIHGFEVNDSALIRYTRRVMERAVKLRRIRLLGMDNCTDCEQRHASDQDHIRWMRESAFPRNESDKKLPRASSALLSVHPRYTT